MGFIRDNVGMLDRQRAACTSARHPRRRASLPARDERHGVDHPSGTGHV